LGLLVAWLTLLAAPIDVEHYNLPYAA